MKKITILLSGVLLLLSMAIFSCERQSQTNSVTREAEREKNLNAPTLKCFESEISNSRFIAIQVVAGATGSPGGFTIQWMLKSEYDANGWPVSDAAANSSFCSATFPGLPNCSMYNLNSNVSVAINLGSNSAGQCGVTISCPDKPLQCGKQYVIRSFSNKAPNGWSRSEYSVTLVCPTNACEGVRG